MSQVSNNKNSISNSNTEKIVQAIQELGNKIHNLGNELKNINEKLDKIYDNSTNVEVRKEENALSDGKQTKKSKYFTPPNLISDIDNRFLDVKNFTPEILEEMNKKFCSSKCETKTILYPTHTE
jgi:predicted  nucleic acid-binding Zn-ribbon protein